MQALRDTELRRCIAQLPGLFKEVKALRAALAKLDGLVRGEIHHRLARAADQKPAICIHF